ncbi:MAG: metallophosphoesterase family protein [Acidimicrobiales bacterium]
MNRVRVLAVSDEVDESFRHHVGPESGIDLVVSCGDLPFDYLADLAGALDVPLVFVPGNHDPDVRGYRQGRRGLVLRAGMPSEPPWPPGAVNADGRVVDLAGLRIAGLGGCLRYGDGPNQYSQRALRWRARRLAPAIAWHRWRDGRPVDLLLTHAPPRGVGDADDLPHRGFDGLHDLVARADPLVLAHGHVHPYGREHPDRRLGRTVVCNVVGRRVLDLEPGVALIGGRDRAEPGDAVRGGPDAP